MNGIVAIGPRTGPFVDRAVHVVHLDGVVVDDMTALHDALAEQVALQGPLVVVVPERLGDRAVRAVATVRAAMGGAPILCHRTSLPPLAADVAVTLAAALREPLGSPAAVAAVLPALERQLLCLTWLPTVKGLADPAPSLAQHAASALPRRSWLVQSWPEPQITRYEPDRLPALPRPGQQVGVAVADDGGEVGWVPKVIDALPGAVTCRVEPPPGTDAHWGARGSTQVVVHPRDIPRLAEALASRVTPGTCRWCHRHVATPMCPWCRLPHDGLVRGGAGRDGRGQNSESSDLAPAAPHRTTEAA